MTRQKQISVDLPSALRPANAARMFARHSAGASFSGRSYTPNTAEILLYDEIGPGGVDALSFRTQLRAARGDLVLKINSPGGSVFDGIAMFNDLAAHPGQVRVEITGIAASAASLLAMAGDEILVAENAFLMIHNAWGMFIGNRHDLVEAAAVMAKLDGALSQTYAKRSGQDPASVEAMMDRETWFSATEAKAAGFSDGILPTADVQARFDLSAYAHPPSSLAWNTEGAGPGPVASARDLEAVLHQAGLSRAAAKKITAGGWAALSQSNHQDDLGAFADRIAAAAAELRRTA